VFIFPLHNVSRKWFYGPFLPFDSMSLLLYPALDLVGQLLIEAGTGLLASRLGGHRMRALWILFWSKEYISDTHVPGYFYCFLSVNER
jgi:hypothetical protein